jgi:hypothetical protein
MQRFNIDELSNGFSKLVRDINTKNPKWKECVGEIDWQIRKYLDNEIYHRNIIQYNLDVNRIGQSVIKCNIKYIEKYCDETKNIFFKERIKTPTEVCRSILFAAENAIIEKVNRESKGGKVCGIMQNS